MIDIADFFLATHGTLNDGQNGMDLRRFAGTKTPLLIIALLGCVFPKCADAQVFNQFPPAFQEEDRTGRELSMHLPIDHLALSAYRNAIDAIQQENITEGIESLQSILDGSSDFLLTDGQGVQRSFVDRVHQVLREHQEDYERLFGPRAQALFDEAIENQDALALAEISRRYSLTKAGQKAFRSWVVLHLDHGEILTAPEGSDLQTLTDNQSSEVATLLKHVEPASEAIAHDWLTPYGTAAHSSRSSFSPAMFPTAWQHPLIDEYDFFLGNITLEEDLLKESTSLLAAVDSRFIRKRGRIAFPAGRPLIVDNTVIVPGYSSPKAFDLKTGELLGVGVKEDETFSYLFEATASEDFAQDQTREEMKYLFGSLRGWRDLTSASLSTDGKYVYAITDCQLVGSTHPDHLIRSSHRHELLPQEFNQLHAYEIDSGLRNLWSIGKRDEHAVIPFDGDGGLPREIFFYGAPLPVNGQLFVIGEERGEIQLFELDGETGEILWSIGLLTQQKKLTLANQRRLAGLMPAFVNGLLICPTGEGVVTAVDPYRRSLRWTHQYGSIDQSFAMGLPFRGSPPRAQNVLDRIDQLISHDRWLDSRIVAVEGTIFFTPPDADRLVAINIEDGTQQWDEVTTRGGLLSLATVFDGDLIFVGENELVAFNAETGERNWSCPIPTPSGRGLRMGDSYVQPVATGEVIFVDLNSGHAFARSLVDEGEPIGNLAAANGRLIVHSGTEIRAFQTLPEIQEDIAKLDSSDVTVRSLQSELDLQSNEPNAIETLASLDQEKLPPRAQSLLAWAMIDKLRTDFRDDQQQRQRLEALLTTPQQRLDYLKNLATGLDKTGEKQRALQQYLRILEESTNELQTLNTQGDVEIVYWRWVIAQIQRISSEANEDQTAAIRESLENWFIDEDTDENSMLAVMRSLSTDVPGVEVISNRLRDLTVTEVNSREVALICEKMLDQQSDQSKARAWKLLTDVSATTGDETSLERYLSALERMPDVPLAKGQTAGEFARTMRAREDLSEMLQKVPLWPKTVEESASVNAIENMHRYQIPVLGSPSTALEGWTFFLDQTGSHIDIYDQNGQRRWRVKTGVSSQSRMGPILGRHVSIKGHLALIVLVDRFLILDCHANHKLPKILVTRPLADDTIGRFRGRGFFPRLGRPQLGFRSFVTASVDGSGFLGNVGPLQPSYLCYGFENHLKAVDPLSGELLWQREDLILGSEIFGDEEYVVVKAPFKDQMRVYRAIDGSFVANRILPINAIRTPVRRQLGDWGRLIPVYEESDDGNRFAMYDPVLDALTWSFGLDEPTVWTTVDGENIAFLSASGEFTIINAQSSRKIISAQVPIKKFPKSLKVLTREKHWILCPGNGPPDFSYFSYPSSPATSTVEATLDGNVIAVNRETGQVSWTVEVENQKFVTQIPSAWPILFFAARRTAEIQLQVINHLTGETLVDDDYSFDSSRIRWKASTNPLLIQIGVGRNTIGIAGEKIVQLEAPSQSESESPSVNDANRDQN